MATQQRPEVTVSSSAYDETVHGTCYICVAEHPEDIRSLCGLPKPPHVSAGTGDPATINCVVCLDLAPTHIARHE